MGFVTNTGVLFVTKYPSKYPTSWRGFPVLTRVTMGCMVLLDGKSDSSSPFTPPAHKVLDLGLARVL